MAPRATNPGHRPSDPDPAGPSSGAKRLVARFWWRRSAGEGARDEIEASNDDLAPLLGSSIPLDARRAGFPCPIPVHMAV